MNDEAILTSREVCVRYKINKYTLLNWRRGFYFAKGKKVWYFEDHAFLETNWNEQLRRLEYNPIKIAVWANKIENKNVKK